MLTIQIAGTNHEVATTSEATMASIDAANTAKTLGDEVFPNVARVGHSLVKDHGNNREVAAGFFKECESLWKKKQEAAGKGTNLPNPWTSAKSVVLSAIELGIPLCDENGNPYGKTAIQKAIKAAKEAGGSVSEKEEEAEAVKETAYETAMRYLRSIDVDLQPKMTKEELYDVLDWMRRYSEH